MLGSKTWTVSPAVFIIYYMGGNLVGEKSSLTPLEYVTVINDPEMSCHVVLDDLVDLLVLSVW